MNVVFVDAVEWTCIDVDNLREVLWTRPSIASCEVWKIWSERNRKILTCVIAVLYTHV